MLNKIWLVWVLGLCLLLLPFVGTNAQDTSITPVEFGMHVLSGEAVEEDMHAAWLDTMLSSGATWYRHDLDWAKIESVPSQYDWSHLDYVIPASSEAGLRLLVSVSNAPEWAHESSSKNVPPEEVFDLIDFLSRVLERYPGMIDAVQIWEQQNTSLFWDTGSEVNPEDYVLLVQKVAQILRSNFPEVLLISGALAPVTTFEEQGQVLTVDNLTYLEAMLDAGLLEYVDCVGVQHPGFNVPPDARWDELSEAPESMFQGPYANPHHSWSFRSTLEISAELVEEINPAMPLCVTSFGWATSDIVGTVPTGYEFALDVSTVQQAEWTLQALDLMLEWGFVKLAVLSNLNAAVLSSDAPEALYSLLDSRSEEQLVLAELVTLNNMALLDGSEFPILETYFVDDDPYLGPENAPVVIVEFSDYLCVFCRRHVALTKPRILEEYGDLVRYVYRDFPTVGGDNAVRAALAAECAHDQGEFWAYHELLFADSSAISGNQTDEALFEYAFELELDMEQFRTCYDEQTHLSDVIADSADAQRLGARGTPFFLINGQPFTGAQPFDEFASVIDAELERLGVER